MTDLTFLDEAAPDTADDGLISFTKVVRVYERVRRCFFVSSRCHHQRLIIVMQLNDMEQLQRSAYDIVPQV